MLIDAYGNLVQVEDTVGNRLRFTGLASDTTTGLIYARVRWYLSTTGRALTTDLVGGGTEDAHDIPVNGHSGACREGGQRRAMATARLQSLSQRRMRRELN